MKRNMPQRDVRQESQETHSSAADRALAHAADRSLDLADARMSLGLNGKAHTYTIRIG
jgi:hypothetical protein